MFGPDIVAAFGEVKQRFDPDGVLNPGKIVDAPKMDDRSLFRYAPDYRVAPLQTRLDWSAYSGAGGGFQGAIEMCNNNGACRKLEGGVMCPSYRVTREEEHVTRGRANTLRLAISGQLGPDALTSDATMEALKLCVSCKACRHECPTGVDMAKMKIEVLAARAEKHGLTLRDRLIGYLPVYAGLASRLAPLANARNGSALLRWVFERFGGISAQRKLPQWRRDAFDPPFESVDASTISSWPGLTRPSTSDTAEKAWMPATSAGMTEPTRALSFEGREVVLLADTFNRNFERENLDAAVAVLVKGGYRVHLPRPQGGGRPLCCGRTFLSVGLVDRARAELDRLVAAFAPFAARGVPIVGLEPSCLLTLRDELLSLRSDDDAKRIGAHALLFEEFLVREAQSGRLQLPLKPIPQKRTLVHGHCHQKSFGAFDAVTQALRLIPELEVETIESSCCGMAGAFGYGADTYNVSMQMAEASLLPAVRSANADTIVVADGTSCRHQIGDGTGRVAMHVARVMARSVGLESDGPS
jgi:Fe-S oxidoreductase